MHKYSQEVVRALFSGLPLAIAGNLALAAILVASLLSAMALQNVIVWLLLMILALVWRTAVLLAYQRHYHPSRAGWWLWHFRISTMATGLVWGFASALIYPSGNISSQVYFAFVLAGVSAGALISLQMDKLAALGFATPVLMSLVIVAALESGNISYAMGLGVFVFVVFFMAASNRAANQLRENFHLREQSLSDQDKLRRSELKNQSILQTLPDIVLVANREGRFTECFDHPDLLVPRDMVLQCAIVDLLPSETAELAMAALRSTLETGELITFKYDLDVRGMPSSFEARIKSINSNEVLIVARNISRPKQVETALLEQQKLTTVIARAQSRFIYEQDRRQAFDVLLSDVLELTRSEYGFIGEVLQTPAGEPYLKTWAITDIAWNDATRNLYQSNAPHGMEFFNLKSLFGAALTSGEPVIANDPAHDPRRGGLPEGHPALTAFLGLPIHHGGKAVAMLGLANRPGGYEQSLVDFLQPLLVALGQLVTAVRVQQQLNADELQLARLSQVASQTTNGVVITDVEGRAEWVNEGFTRITGYTLDEIYGQKPGQLLQGPETDLQTVAEIRAALIRGEGFEADLVNYTKAGKPYWIRIQCNPLRDEKRLLQGFIAIESDVTREKQDAARLSANERRLASVIDGTNIGTWEWNIQTGETVINQRWADIVGYTLEELAPINIQTLLSLVHPEDAEMSGQLLERHFAGDHDFYDCIARIRHKHGHWVWVHDRGRVLSWTDDGKPLLMSGTRADITAQKQAELALRDSEARLRGLFELSPIGIALNDYETGAFLDVNPALLRPTGYTLEEFFTLRYWDITPDEYRAEDLLQLETLEKTGRYGPFEKEYFRKDGSRYPVLLNGMLVYDNSGRRLIWSIVEDISERRRVERMKSEFISTVSHELRTPLTAISGALSLVISGATGPLPDNIHELLRIADNNSRRLGLLINDLLDIEKLEAGRLRFDMQVQALYQLLELAVWDNQIYADRLNVRLVLEAGDDGILVRVDVDRMQQILTNLFSNAAKFSPPGGNVLVTVAASDETVRVKVADKGPGIPEEFRTRIFEKFSQADSSDTRSQGGTGLGLAISRELTERMDGRMGFDSVAGEGSIFWVEFPLYRRPQKLNSDVGSPPAGVSQS